MNITSMSAKLFQTSKTLSKPALNIVNKTAIVATITSAAMLSQVTNAASSNTVSTIPIDMSGMSVTKHEIAVMQVLSEICPAMLSSKQKPRFYKSYNAQLQELMPTLDDPRAAIQYLSTQQDYRQILQSMRSWTMSFSKQENKAICEDLANSSF